MPDDPNKRGPQDRKRVSQREHEQRDQKEKNTRQDAATEQDETGRNPGENES